MDGDVITAERVIPASPEAIFAILVDANRHPEFDGSGALVKAKPGAPSHLSLGTTFGMSMKMGIGYSMVNTVIEYEENALVAWQARPPGILGKLSGGRIWRYRLEKVDGGTRVQESWDISQDKQRSFLRRGSLPEKTKVNMEKSLERLRRLATSESASGA